jgi:hypothetical protein
MYKFNQYIMIKFDKIFKMKNINIINHELIHSTEIYIIDKKTRTLIYWDCKLHSNNISFLFYNNTNMKTHYICNTNMQKNYIYVNYKSNVCEYINKFNQFKNETMINAG